MYKLTPVKRSSAEFQSQLDDELAAIDEELLEIERQLLQHKQRKLLQERNRQNQLPSTPSVISRREISNFDVMVMKSNTPMKSLSPEKAIHMATPKVIPRATSLWRLQSPRKSASLALPRQSISTLRVFGELYCTEATYVDDLELICNVFVIPLRTQRILSEDFLEDIFSNITQVLSVHRRLLQNVFQERSGSQKEALAIFQLMLPEMEQVYLEYCSNHNRAVATLQRLKIENFEFKQFLTNCQSLKECRMLDLEAFLIKPIQRITKYPLLLNVMLSISSSHNLQELVKETNSGLNYITSEELELVVSLHEQLKIVVNSINESMRQSAFLEADPKYQQAIEYLKLNTSFGHKVFPLDNTHKLTFQRKLLRQGQLTYLPSRNKKPKEMTGYLFSDGLLLLASFRTQTRSRRNSLLSMAPPIFENNSTQTATFLTEPSIKIKVKHLLYPIIHAEQADEISMLREDRISNACSLCLNVKGNCLVKHSQLTLLVASTSAMERSMWVGELLAMTMKRKSVPALSSPVSAVPHTDEVDDSNWKENQENYKTPPSRRKRSSLSKAASFLFLNSKKGKTPLCTPQ